MAFGNIRTVLIIFAVSGIVMVTADDETVAMQTMNDTMMPLIGGALEDLINNIVMDGIAGEIGNIAYNISNIMVSNLTIDNPNVTFQGLTVQVELSLPMFEISADWEVSYDFNFLSYTITRSGTLSGAADELSVVAVYAFPTFQFQSCDANVDFSLELSGRGVLVRLASLVLQSNAVTSVLQTGIEQAICTALSAVTPETPER